MSELTSTIAAISTPPGKGGVAVIRLSGPLAFEIAGHVFRPRGKRRPEEAPRTAVYGDFMESGTVVDDGLATAFPAPCSYTGEDTVELSCHGGILITRTILEALFVAGAVPAAPGEFTRRAYLSGRLGLSEAEAIATLLDAKSAAQVHLSATRSLLSERIAALFGELLTLVSAEEALIDFPEEDLSEMTEEELSRRLDAISAEIAELCRTYRTGRAVTEGVATAIVGRPNVGKSSLYNLLLGEEAAIVSEVEGTTRDILEKTVPLGRVLLRLFDTAGIRESSDPIERIGVERARAAIGRADLVLAVFDAAEPLTEDDRALMSELSAVSVPRIAILNKADLPERIEREEIAAHFPTVLSLSARGGSVGPLVRAIDTIFTDGELVIGEDAIVSSARQYAALCRAHEALDRARQAMMVGLPTDMVLFELTEALSALGEVDGRTVSEAVVDEIFRHFCVGK